MFCLDFNFICNDDVRTSNYLRNMALQICHRTFIAFFINKSYEFYLLAIFVVKTHF